MRKNRENKQEQQQPKLIKHKYTCNCDIYLAIQNNNGPWGRFNVDVEINAYVCSQEYKSIKQTFKPKPNRCTCTPILTYVCRRICRRSYVVNEYVA